MFSFFFFFFVPKTTMALPEDSFSICSKASWINHQGARHSCAFVLFSVSSATLDGADSLGGALEPNPVLLRSGGGSSSWLQLIKR